MEDNEIIPYSDKFSQSQLKGFLPLANFIAKFKRFNFMRTEKKKLSDVFDRFDNAVLRSAKINHIYVMFRGMSVDEQSNSIYTDEYPSSWTTDINVAIGFSNGRKSRCIMKGVFRPFEILMDISYCLESQDYECEVLLLPGTYEVGYVSAEDLKSQVDTYYPLTSITISNEKAKKHTIVEKEKIEEEKTIDEMTLEEIFHPKNIDDLKSEDEQNKFFFEYDDLLGIANELELKIGSKPSKNKLIMLLIHHYNLK